MKAIKNLIRKFKEPKVWHETETINEYRIKEVYEGFYIEVKRNVWQFTKYPFFKAVQKFWIEHQPISGIMETKQQAETELERIKLLPKYHY